MDDPSDYVRRSVSNHLNDLCRVDPELALEVARRGGRPTPTRARIAGGWCAGDCGRWSRPVTDVPSRLLGHDPDVAVSATLELHTERVALGGAAEWTLAVRSLESDPVEVVIDYVVHHVRADGSTGPKVNKWTTRSLAPGAQLELRRRHVIRPITTRTFHDGAHLVEVQVNGTVVASAVFELSV